MKVLTTVDYGFRKVVRILINNRDPQWVHEDRQGKRTASPKTHTGDTEEKGKTVCPDCRNNWIIFEALFEGDDLLKTDKEIISEAREMAKASVPVHRETA